MNFKIISDSSSDILNIDGIPYSSVPLKIRTDNKEYIDDSTINVTEMIDDLKKYKGVSGSSCPNTEEWISSFEDYDNIFCITITSNLSGSYNSARLAVDDYISQNNNRKGYVIDSLSVGPESALIIEKLCQLIKQGHEFEEIKSQITDYQNTTHLIFCLDSLRNLANNGRVSAAVAKFAGLLGIRIVGKASLEGTLEITDKCRGSAKAHQSIINNMLKEGYNGGKLRIHHCENPDGASLLEEEIKSRFPKADVSIKETRALCSFYAESGGLLVGFEGKRK